MELKHYPIVYKKDHSKDQGWVDGWHSQQVYKFKIFEDIRDDYLILDSKNFFVKPCSLNLWDNILGSGSYESLDIKQKWLPTIINYSRWLNCKPPKKFLKMQTPFKITAEFMRRITYYNDFLEWFSNNPELTSEFIFYSILTQDQFAEYNKNTLHYTFWPDISANKLNDIDNIDVYVMAFHRNFLSKLTNIEQNLVNSFIKKTIN